MKSQFNNEQATLFFEGQIDSTNATEVERDIIESLKNRRVDHLILDLYNVSYISSAGLRIVLKMKQQYQNVTIVNASPEVYDVLQMTGFTKMMEIHRRLVEIDVSHAELIGEGFFSLVYRIDKDTIIKVFRQATSLESVERELNLAKQAFVLGIPTAISFDVVKVGDKLGVRFEMLDCASLRDIYRDDPSRYEEMTERYAKLLLTINTTESLDPTLLDAKKAWLAKAKTCAPYLDKAESDKLFALLESVPDRDTFVHGDCHYKNIMVQGDELLLIDMDTLGKGHPIFELASIYAPYVAFEECDHGNTQRFMGISAEFTQKMFHDLLKIYFGADRPDYFKKIGLVSYCHMIWWNSLNAKDNIAQRDFMIRRLKESLKEVDDLDIGK